MEIIFQEREEKEEEEAQMAGWTTTAAASSSDGIKHKIVASSTIHQPPSLSHTEEQVMSSQCQHLCGVYYFLCNIDVETFRGSVDSMHYRFDTHGIVYSILTSLAYVGLVKIWFIL